MFATATHAEFIHDHKDYGFTFNGKPEFKWSTVKEKRDAYVKKLNGIYENNLNNDKIQQFTERAVLAGKNKVSVGTKQSQPNTF